jgi:hypothetical protein
VRTRTAKYAVYFDPSGEASSEYELYDLDRDPLEVDNLVDHRTGLPRPRSAAPLRDELAERLAGELERCGTGERVPRV